MATNYDRILVKKPRPRGEIYSKLGFELLKNEKRKYTALCLFCKVMLKNTAVKRLTNHRNVCTHVARATKKWKIRTETTEQLINDKTLVDENESTAAKKYNTRTGTTEPPIDIKNLVDEHDKSTATSSLCTYSNNSLISTEIFDDINFGLDCNIILDGQPKELKNNQENIMLPRNNEKIFSYLDNITKEDEEHINNSLGKFFFADNLPFSVIESNNFKNFIQIIRPGYVNKLPSKNDLSSTLLDRVHKNCLTTIQKNIGPESTILISGWSTFFNQTKPIVSILYSSNGERAFLKTWNVTGTSNTNEQFATIVMESQELARSRFNTTVNAVVSDFIVNWMEIERRTLLWHNTCNLFIVNMLAKDIFTRYSDSFKSVGLIIKNFNHPDLQLLILEKGGVSINIASEEQWCSFRDNVVSLGKNFQYMKEIASDQNLGKKVKQEVKLLLFNDQLKTDMERAFKIIDPICELILKYQNINCSLADAVHGWITLKNSLVYQHFPEEFHKRKELAVNLYALSAYFLDPNYDQSNLEPNEKIIAIEFIIQNLTYQGVTEFDLFMKKDGLFSILFQKNIKDAMVFWNMAMYKYPDLSKLARKLLQIPASSAETERLCRFDHSSNQNLSFERSKKLSEIYYSLNIRDSSRSEDY